MSKSTAWLPWFLYVMLGLMLSMAAWCIYTDGFTSFTWLSHACLAGMLWVLLPTSVPLAENLHIRSPRFWVAVAAASGIVADLLLL